MLENTTCEEDRVVDRAESVKEETPVIDELLSICKRLDEKLEAWKNAAPSDCTEPEELKRWVEDNE